MTEHNNRSKGETTVWCQKVLKVSDSREPQSLDMCRVHCMSEHICHGMNYKQKQHLRVANLEKSCCECVPHLNVLGIKLRKTFSQSLC